MKGDSVTINSDLAEMKDDHQIKWSLLGDNDKWSSETLLAEINKQTDSMTVYDDVLDERFRDRLKLNNQTGSLTITNIRHEHAGEYKRLIMVKNSGYGQTFLLAVFDDISVIESESVTLNSDLSEITGYEWIRWRFGNDNTLIAEINKKVDRFTVYDDVLDGRFRERLKLDNQTLSLTITDTRTEHTGRYKLQICVEGSYSKRFSIKAFSVSVYARLPVPVISRDCSSSSSSSSYCSLSCSVLNVSHVTLSWYKGNSLLFSISVSDLSISLSLPLEVEYQDKNSYSCVLNNPFSNQTQHLDITQLCQPCPVEVSVMEGDSVTINPDLTEIKDDNVIQWKFGPTTTIAEIIAEINKQTDSMTVYDDVLDERFRDRLKLDNQTGSLTITNTRHEHDGVYYAVINGAILSLQSFRVSVYSRLSIPVISSNSSQCSSSSSSSYCSLLCSVVHVSHVTLFWYKGNSLLSSISVSDLSISLSLPLEVEYQDKNSYSCVINNPISNQTQHLDISQLCHTCSGTAELILVMLVLILPFID
uniref:Ig-like domain-containing protein n=1 Tax=Cyprinus carpio TaxID=7962 RepID=A0A8C2FHZ8_CYPCA